MAHGKQTNREQHIINAVPCPTCGAKIGERCKGIIDHAGKRGLPPMRSDAERRYQWQQWKLRNEARQ